MLDGGEKEVFLGGSRLTKFIESVEAATSCIPTTTAEDENADTAPPAPAPEPEPPQQKQPTKKDATPTPTPAPAPAPGSETEEDNRPAPTVPTNPWAGLLQVGAALLQQLVANPQTPSGGGNGSAASFVRKDEQTGEQYMRFPMPPPDVLNQAMGAASVASEHAGTAP